MNIASIISNGISSIVGGAGGTIFNLLGGGKSVANDLGGSASGATAPAGAASNGPFASGLTQFFANAVAVVLGLIVVFASLGGRDVAITNVIKR